MYGCMMLCVREKLAHAKWQFISHMKGRAGAVLAYTHGKNSTGSLVSPMFLLLNEMTRSSLAFVQKKEDACTPGCQKLVLIILIIWLVSSWKLLHFCVHIVRVWHVLVKPRIQIVLSFVLPNTLGCEWIGPRRITLLCVYAVVIPMNSQVYKNVLYCILTT